MNIFAREITEPLASLVKQLDEKLAENGKVRGFVVLLTEDSDEAETGLKKLASNNKIEKLPLTLIESNAGPASYKIAKDAAVTVHLWVGGKVVANYAFAKGELDSKAIKKITEQIPSVFEK